MEKSNLYNHLEHQLKLKYFLDIIKLIIISVKDKSFKNK